MKKTLCIALCLLLALGGAALGEEEWQDAASRFLPGFERDADGWLESEATRLVFLSLMTMDTLAQDETFITLWQAEEPVFAIGRTGEDAGDKTVACVVFYQDAGMCWQVEIDPIGGAARLRMSAYAGTADELWAELRETGDLSDDHSYPREEIIATMQYIAEALDAENAE